MEQLLKGKAVADAIDEELTLSLIHISPLITKKSNSIVRFTSGITLL